MGLRTGQLARLSLRNRVNRYSEYCEVLFIHTHELIDQLLVTGEALI